MAPSADDGHAVGVGDFLSQLLERSLDGLVGHVRARLEQFQAIVVKRLDHRLGMSFRRVTLACDAMMPLGSTQNA